jgi:hypothetical protein
MNWFSVQMNAAIIAGVVSLSITLVMVLVAVILTNRKVHRNFNLEFAVEGVAREMLMDRKWPFRTFRVLKYHLCGFTDDELEKSWSEQEAFGSRPVDTRFGGFSRGIASTSASRKSRKLQQLKLLSIPLVNSRSINSSSSKSVGRKTNWISHVTHQGPLSVRMQR